MRGKLTLGRTGLDRAGFGKSGFGKSGPRRGDRGVTLIELMVAVMVLSMGTLAALRAIDQSGRAVAEEPARLFARQVALNRIVELQVIGAAAGRSLATEETMGPFRFDIGVAEAATAAGLIEVRVSARLADGPSSVMVGYVPASPAP